MEAKKKDELKISTWNVRHCLLTGKIQDIQMQLQYWKQYGKDRKKEIKPTIRYYTQVKVRQDQYYTIQQRSWQWISKIPLR